jgi:hypothetical protein
VLSKRISVPIIDESKRPGPALCTFADLPGRRHISTRRRQKQGSRNALRPALWKLWHLPRWRKDLQECWKKLEAGDYEWAHLAYSIWPDRVREVCRTDRSIAIAHDLESLCEVATKTAKKKRSKKIAVEETVPGDDE